MLLPDCTAIKIADQVHPLSKESFTSFSHVVAFSMPLQGDRTTTITFCQLLLTDAREVVVVQLKLLGLTIPEESGIVRMNAMMRADPRSI